MQCSGKHIDRKYKTLGNEPRNLRFGLSMDGMNSFGNTCITFLLGYV
jgi:hypothetical protein